MYANKESAIKIFLYILVAISVFCIQTTLIPGVYIKGYRIDMLPSIVAVVALMSGEMEAAIIGFLIGALYDKSYVYIEGFYPAYYMFVGALSGVLAKIYLRKIYPAALLITISIGFIANLLRYAIYIYLYDRTSVLLAFQTMCAELLITAILSPIIYIIIKRISLIKLEK